MKIAIIGYFQPSGPMSYGSISNWIANSWEYLGHEVIKIDREEVNKYFNENAQCNCDLIFFVDCSEDYSNIISNIVIQVPKIFWAMDVQMLGGTERSVNIARKCDYTFCTNYEFGVKILEKFGIETMWVPYGYDYILQREIKEEELYANRLSIKEYDVCMIGNANSPERVQLWELLKKEFGNRAFVGTVDNKKNYIKAKAHSKIVVNQPTAGFNNIINLRVFNATACGKLLLCHSVSIKEMELLGFRNRINVVYWDEFDDLIDKIKYYLNHRIEREKIADKGCELGQKYLLNNSVRIIEQVIFSKFYERLI